MLTVFETVSLMEKKSYHLDEELCLRLKLEDT
jgi:hypothetical protein